MDGIVATNTTIRRTGLVTDVNILERIGTGGLSGEPIRDRATEIIRYIHQITNGKLPIIGVGGIMTPMDALEKISAGATLVQVYTGFVYEGPGIIKRINKLLGKKALNHEPPSV
jgi:dihydroorotate dehydrogenase